MKQSSIHRIQEREVTGKDTEETGSTEKDQEKERSRPGEGERCKRGGTKREHRQVMK